MSRLDKLPPNTEDTHPAEVEVIKPPSELEIKMIMDSKQAQRASEQAFLRGKTEVLPPPLLEAKAKIPEVVAPDVKHLLERVRSGKVVAVADPAPVDLALAGAAHLLVNRLASLSAEWGAKVESMRVERGLRDDQICFALMANSLDSNQHMIVPADHPYFHESFKAAGTNFNCLICDEPGSRKYPGQPPLCGNKCANQFYKLPESDRQELLEAAA
jgi:hypothetical protein